MALKDNPKTWAEYQREWRRKNPEKCREIKRRNREKNPDRQRQYQHECWERIKSVRGYYELLEKQSGLCAICQKPMSKPQHDHSHTSGKWRGLLCCKCNWAIGLFEEDIEVISRAIDYLLEYRD